MKIKLAKKKIDVKSYTRIKLGKKESVKKHVRAIAPGPRMDKKKLKDIKEGKAKKLVISETITISPEELEKKEINGYRRWGTRIIKVHIDAFDYVKKNGKKVHVKEHDRTVYVWIEPEKSKFTMRKIRGEERLVEIFNYKEKEYIRIVEDQRKQGKIAQSDEIKEKRWLTETMVKKMPDNIMKGFKEIGKDTYEHSFMVDFERYLEQPQRVAIVKGGMAKTPKFQDFELFGHSHPNQRNPSPSLTDVRLMKTLEPEFIIAAFGGKTIFLNIENENEHSKWKERNVGRKGNTHPYEFHDVKRVLRRKKYQGDKEAQKFNGDYQKSMFHLLESKKGREIFLDITGVKVFPYKKNLTIELKDYLYLGKKMPNIPREDLSHYQIK